MNLVDPHADLCAATRRHRSQHGCGAYTFEDGPGLFALIRSLAPKTILELGCGLGYSACTMAAAAPSATIITVDGDAEHVALAREAIGKRDLTGRIEVRHASFAAVLETSARETFDLVFFDGFAPEPAMIAWIARVMATDGHFICSNTQLSGSIRQLETAFEKANFEKIDRSLERGRTKVFRFRRCLL